jgi:hypothetical protein
MSTQEELILKNAKELSKRFAERAQRVDKQGVFPSENLRELSETVTSLPFCQSLTG